MLDGVKWKILHICLREEEEREALGGEKKTVEVSGYESEQETNVRYIDGFKCSNP